jgi:hypothetical protein
MSKHQCQYSLLNRFTDYRSVLLTMGDDTQTKPNFSARLEEPFKAFVSLVTDQNIDTFLRCHKYRSIASRTATREKAGLHIIG